MSHLLKIIEVGDSAEVILPDEVIAALKLKEGDAVILRADSGGFYLTADIPKDPAGSPT